MIIFVLLFIILILGLIIIRLIYNEKGSIIITKDEEGQIFFFLELDKEPEEIAKSKSVRFQVIKGKSQNKQ